MFFLITGNVLSPSGIRHKIALSLTTCCLLISFRRYSKSSRIRRNQTWCGTRPANPLAGPQDFDSGGTSISQRVHHVHDTGGRSGRDSGELPGSVGHVRGWARLPLGRHRWLSLAFADHSTKIQTSSSMPMAQTVCDSARTESDIHTKGSGGGRRKAICRQRYMDMAMWLKVS